METFASQSFDRYDDINRDSKQLIRKMTKKISPKNYLPKLKDYETELIQDQKKNLMSSLCEMKMSPTIKQTHKLELQKSAMAWHKNELKSTSPEVQKVDLNTCRFKMVKKVK